MTNIERFPIHLSPDGRDVVLPAFTGDMAWYEGYGARFDHEGAGARLVSMHSFTESWDSWEMHPLGDEVVLCTVGEITLRQQQADGSPDLLITLAAGEYAINAPGVWHTADIEGEATALFITAGIGTQHKPR